VCHAECVFLSLVGVQGNEGLLRGRGRIAAKLPLNSNLVVAARTIRQRGNTEPAVAVQAAESCGADALAAVVSDDAAILAGELALVARLAGPAAVTGARAVFEHTALILAFKVGAGRGHLRLHHSKTPRLNICLIGTTANLPETLIA